MEKWELSVATEKFEELMLKCFGVPQAIVVDGQTRAIVVSHFMYCRLADIDMVEWPGTDQQKKYEKQGFRQSAKDVPWADEAFDDLCRILDSFREEES